MNPPTLSRPVLAGSLAALLVVLVGCRPESAPPSAVALPAAVVRVQPAASGVHRATEEVVGTLRARLRSAIEAKISGRIERLFVSPGDRVDEGAPLVQLDVRETQARVDQARAVLGQADRDLERFRALLENQALTRAEFDAAEARQRVARGALTEVETMVGYAAVKAPFAGVVTRKLADVGDLAAPGRPLLELEDPTSLRFEADVPVSFLDRVKLGDSLPITVASVAGTLTGKVGEIEPSADPVSRTFRVKLDLPPGTTGRAGLFGRVSIPAGESPVLTVPASAILARGQLELAFVEDGGKARLRIVKTGKRLGTDVEILSGLEAGERVVIEGATGLVDGQPVKVR